MPRVRLPLHVRSICSLEGRTHVPNEPVQALDLLNVAQLLVASKRPGVLGDHVLVHLVEEPLVHTPGREQHEVVAMPGARSVLLLVPVEARREHPDLETKRSHRRLREGVEALRRVLGPVHRPGEPRHACGDRLVLGRRHHVQLPPHW